MLQLIDHKLVLASAHSTLRDRITVIALASLFFADDVAPLAAGWFTAGVRRHGSLTDGPPGFGGELLRRSLRISGSCSYVMGKT